MKPRNIVFLILAILLTAFIFSNSMRDAAASDGQSGRFVAALEQFAGLFGTVIPHNATVTIVRKGAHMAEFFLLSCCWCGVFWQRAHRFWAYCVYILFAGLLTACCDEWIQLFSDGRASEVCDVFIDFAGVLLAVLAGLGIDLIQNRRRRKHGPIC